MTAGEASARDIVVSPSGSGWPELPLHAWKETYDTLHRWTQLLGKIRMALTPRINHWWNVPLYVSARGLTTSTIPYGERWFELELDFIDDALHLRTNDGADRTVSLEARSVAAFFAETMSALHAEGIDCRIWTVPVECEDVIRLDRDERHQAYDKRYVMRLWRILALSSVVLNNFRARFVGKCSPVHFFWGSFDLAVTRFSGRRAPVREGAGAIEREAYSHEVSSVGWWPGDSRLEQPAFYSYASPEPPGFADASISTPHTYYHPTLHGFYLHYEDVRHARDPEALILEFCQTTYEAAANLGRWDRAELERPPVARSSR